MFSRAGHIHRRTGAIPRNIQRAAGQIDFHPPLQLLLLNTDHHRILTRGGIFMYPWDKREPNKPGKLRLMYEANPMAFLIEQAGGMATNGTQRIMDIQPTKLHERVSVILGSRNEVRRVTEYHLEDAEKTSQA